VGKLAALRTTIFYKGSNVGLDILLIQNVEYHVDNSTFSVNCFKIHKKCPGVIGTIRMSVLISKEDALEFYPQL
jgi:hypothetical protein